ncbi:MAG TPA: nucleoid occlusion protein [Syntrophomonadaceae bacterium]|jgi:ParB family chromosome partitioning protein|nr:nucleoid occlusion protein [Syntrophomonadaceae bacterium]
MKPFDKWLAKVNPRKVLDLPLEAISRNPYQPRKDFNDLELKELAQSISNHGVIQPIIVRKSSIGYQLIAGERRLRACQMIGKKTIPAIIHDITDREVAAVSLIENLQRKNLNYFEEAEAYTRLINNFGMTQEEIAHSIGRSQSYVANKLRLLKLAKEVRCLIVTETVSERHARALLKINSVQTQKEVLLAIYEKELTVKDTEEIVENLRHNNLPQEKNYGSSRQQVSSVIKDARIFMNTIRETVNRARKIGIDMVMTENDKEDEFEFIIRVPKLKRQPRAVVKG